MKKLLFSIIFLMIYVNIVHAQLSVVFNGDTTEIWDSNFSWACGGRFFPITRISQDTIYITERDTMDRTLCDCYISVHTKLTDLNTGTYTVLVTRQYQYHMRSPVDTIIGFSDYIGSINFTIVTLPTKQSQIAFYQSPCSSQSVDNGMPIPKNFLLLTNYPNPFNPSTIIQYKVPSKSHVVLSIYNLAGQQIATLVDEQKSAGSYDINYNATHLSSGMYVCHLIVGGNTISTKMILIK
ncbi:MAG: T9SS type A sorting domain-containing protein [Bacteroidota bacterium]